MSATSDTTELSTATEHGDTTERSAATEHGETTEHGEIMDFQFTANGGFTLSYATSPTVANTTTRGSASSNSNSNSNSGCDGASKEVHLMEPADSLTLEAQLAAADVELRVEKLRHESKLRELRHRVKELQRRLLQRHRQQGNATQGLAAMAAVQNAFQFIKEPVDVLSASTACRRWRELACAGSVWRDKAEREGIVDKAAAFEVEVPRVAEGGSALDEETASMAFYARVFVLKVGGTAEGGREGRRDGETEGGREGGPVAVFVSPPLAAAAAALPPPPRRGTR